MGEYHDARGQSSLPDSKIPVDLTRADDFGVSRITRPRPLNQWPRPFRAREPSDRASASADVKTRHLCRTSFRVGNESISQPAQERVAMDSSQRRDFCSEERFSVVAMA